MTNRCSATSSRPSPVSIEPNESRPSAEDVESRAIARERASEREAELARNRYFESFTHEGGRCLDASSDAGAYSPFHRDDPALKDSRRTAALDPPIEKDGLGNAVAGAVISGVVGGARTSAAWGTPVMTEIARQVAIKVVKSAIKHEVKALVREQLESAVTPAVSPSTGGAPSPAAADAAPAPAGRTSPKAASEIVKEPNMTPGPAYTPLLVRG